MEPEDDSIFKDAAFWVAFVGILVGIITLVWRF